MELAGHEVESLNYTSAVPASAYQDIGGTATEPYFVRRIYKSISTSDKLVHTRKGNRKDNIITSMLEFWLPSSPK